MSNELRDALLSGMFSVENYEERVKGWSRLLEAGAQAIQETEEIYNTAISNHILYDNQSFGL